MKEFARIDDVKAGDKLTPDDGFDCLKVGSVLVVQADADGKLYVPCDEGNHYLNGQIGGPLGGFETETHYVGLYKII